jgi:hypothetical protein
MGNQAGEIEVTGDVGKRVFFCGLNQAPVGLKVGDTAMVTYRTTKSLDNQHAVVKISVKGKKSKQFA